MPKFLARRGTLGKAVAAKRTFRDFRAHDFCRPGDFRVLLGTDEVAEIECGALGDEKLAADPIAMSYTRRFALSREALVNDGIGAFAELATMAAVRSLEQHADQAAAAAADQVAAVAAESAGDA